MAKINVKFNDTNYQIDESVFDESKAKIAAHLSSEMKGVGASINFDSTTYDVDSTRLDAATNKFVSNLGTIAGSDKTVIVAGVAYGIDSAKVAGAMTEVETTLVGMSGSEEPGEPELPASEGLLYALNADGESYYFDSMGDCTDTDVVIASVYEGKPVTVIGYAAFGGRSSLTSVIIPNSVTQVESLAFDGCLSLKSINIPDGVTFIGCEAFRDCTSLESITLPNGFTRIENGTFSHCAALTSITIPDSVEYISDSAFFSCSSLTSITIPDSVTSIGSSAFRYCRSLTDITFNGTKAQWNAISKGTVWDYDTGNYIVHCTDGNISKNGSTIGPVEPGQSGTDPE